jgi:hypothetical protein
MTLSRCNQNCAQSLPPDKRQNRDVTIVRPGMLNVIARVRQRRTHHGHSLDILRASYRSGTSAKSSISGLVMWSGSASGNTGRRRCLTRCPVSLLCGRVGEREACAERGCTPASRPQSLDVSGAGGYAGMNGHAAHYSVDGGPAVCRHHRCAAMSAGASRLASSDGTASWLLRDTSSARSRHDLHHVSIFPSWRFGSSMLYWGSMFAG